MSPGKGPGGVEGDVDGIEDEYIRKKDNAIKPRSINDGGCRRGHSAAVRAVVVRRLVATVLLVYLEIEHTCPEFVLHRYGLSLRLRCVLLLSQTDSFSGEKPNSQRYQQLRSSRTKPRVSAVGQAPHLPRVAD